MNDLSNNCGTSGGVLVDGFRPGQTQTTAIHIHKEGTTHGYVVAGRSRNRNNMITMLDRQRYTNVPLLLYFSAVNVDAATESSSKSPSTFTSPQQEPQKSNDKKDNEWNSYSKRPMRINIEGYGDLPWSDAQEWALIDNLTKYSFRIFGRDGTMQRLVRWRTMINNTPELAGYPIEFIIVRYETVVATLEPEHQALWRDLSTQVLPYIDQFRFESNGGLSGQVFGILGIQDGTRIQTNPLVKVENSIPWGYVVTEDEPSVVYELGQPETDATRNGVDVDMVQNIAPTSTTNLMRNILTSSTTKGEFMNYMDPDLIQLTGLTVVVLTGAWAMQTLSHHLTVNIFWV